MIKDVCLKGLLAVLKRTDAFQSHLNGITVPIKIVMEYFLF